MNRLALLVDVVSRARTRRGFFAAVAAVASALGCSSQSTPSASACPNDLPVACAATPPSYARDVAPILAAKCVVCHGPGGVEATRDLSTYDHVHTQRSSVLDQVHACMMPPAGGEALTAAERATLLGWLVCGAPQN
jgi:mono/diheme cytochrome c family protein